MFGDTNDSAAQLVVPRERFKFEPARGFMRLGPDTIAYCSMSHRCVALPSLSQSVCIHAAYYAGPILQRIPLDRGICATTPCTACGSSLQSTTRIPPSIGPWALLGLA